MKKVYSTSFILALLVYFCLAVSPLTAATGMWPNNKFIQLVTKPDFAIDSVDVDSYGDGGTCNINFTDVTVEQLKAYAQTLKSDGFRYHVEEITDMTGAYTFRAGDVEKGDGFMVILGPKVFGKGMFLKISSATF